MIRTRIFLVVVVLMTAGLLSLNSWAKRASTRYIAEALPAQRQLVKTLSLTDLAIWTEARYTRHPAMADLFSAFQDHPGAFDHFPAGSLLAPTAPRPETTLEIRRRGAS